MNKDVSIGGQYHYAFGELDLSHLDYTHMMTFSKDMKGRQVDAASGTACGVR